MNSIDFLYSWYVWGKLFYTCNSKYSVYVQHEVKHNGSQFYNGFQLTEIVPAEYVILRALVSLEENKEAIKVSSYVQSLLFIDVPF